MKYYAGLDVSLKETFVSILDEDGQIYEERMVGSDVESLSSYLRGTGLKFYKIGIESGSLSIFLCKGLSSLGYPVICLDARHAAAALSARSNKNDRNDARGIAQLLRTGWEKVVQVKSDISCEQKVLLGAREQLVKTRQQVMGTIRGLLKIYGIKLGAQVRFSEKVEEALQRLSSVVQGSIQALLSSLASLEASLESLDAFLKEAVKKSETCQRLQSVPGVGPVTALTYVTSLDQWDRFEQSETVGAYLGLTPRQYASGEVNRHGSISKMGPKRCRVMLYEAAQSLLFRTKESFALKKWGLRLARKKGKKKAIVAVARKLSVVMHRMLVAQTEFRMT